MRLKVVRLPFVLLKETDVFGFFIVSVEERTTSGDLRRIEDYLPLLQHSQDPVTSNCGRQMLERVSTDQMLSREDFAVEGYLHDPYEPRPLYVSENLGPQLVEND